jgi:hypothetical protein
MADSTKRFIDKEGMAYIYKIIEDQLGEKIDRAEFESLIRQYFNIEIIDDGKDYIHLYGGSASDLL